MLKKIPAGQLRQELISVLNSVRLKRRQYIVERNGEPLAAVVPVDVAVQREEDRTRLREIMKQPTPFDQMSEEAFDRMIDREIQAVRRMRRRKPSR
ncbi:MAG: hypothetical protein HY238_03560 [Acidobacteria bacterium]|nr:hypothetical protein [Acidobacteriota bacterium]